MKGCHMLIMNDDSHEQDVSDDDSEWQGFGGPVGH